jgi:hypothetical protein
MTNRTADWASVARRLPATLGAPSGGVATALKTWATSRTNPLLGRLATLTPGARVGTLEVPLPKVAHEDYKALIKGAGIPGRVEDAPTQKVAIAGLTAIQNTVNAERLEGYLENPHLTPVGARGVHTGMKKDLPVIVKKAGKSFIHDGHHRIVAAALRGEKAIKARVVNLEGAAA